MYKLRVRGVLLEELTEITPVEDFSVRCWGIGQREYRWVQVESVDHDISLHGSGDTWSGDNERHAGTPFLKRYFSAVEWMVVGIDLTASALHATVVRSKKHICVFHEFVTRPSWVVSVFE